MSDEKHEEIRRLSSALIERNPKVFQPLLSSLRYKEKEDHRHSSRNCRTVSPDHTDFAREFEQDG